MIAHGNEMYGVSGVYLRSKNIVPPRWSRMGGMRGGARAVDSAEAAGGAGSSESSWQWHDHCKFRPFCRGLERESRLSVRTMAASGHWTPPLPRSRRRGSERPRAHLVLIHAFPAERADVGAAAALADRAVARHRAASSAVSTAAPASGGHVHGRLRRRHHRPPRRAAR